MAVRNAGTGKSSRRHWIGAGIFSVALHLAVVAVLILSGATSAPFSLPEPPRTPIAVTLFRPPPPEPPPVPEQRTEAPAQGGSSAPPTPAEAEPDPPPAP
ncbi:MAG TPA: hypothetical protein VEB62_08615, partial [Brevundimonas sp.]|nr:hypothetical protein [Brevundimonas sp.]